MSNRLALEQSPYLRQHMDNPVDWYPWGPEALEAARREDKPILLSVGYAACHWCHVMEHESFENADTAALMNRLFINIKVDREERPDLDHIYMAACQLCTGSGGWPLTVFLTPDLKPFFCGTYFPPQDRYGRPGFPKVLQSLADAWDSQQEDVAEQAARFVDALADLARGPEGTAPLNVELIMRGAGAALRRFDAVHGGFGQAPKFPSTSDLLLLEAAARRNHEAAGHAVTLTCRSMARGGIHDQLGGGFHRYSVDERWAVPHFEKMLYDNALLARVYLSALRRTGEAWLSDVVEDLFAYVAREMTAPSGAFFSTQDADSEGEEGRFFVWTPAQVEAVLGPEAAKAACLHLGVTAEGNFEHHSTVLHVAQDPAGVAQALGWTLEATTARLKSARAGLFEARRARVAPARDEKILAGWNGLMVSALADGATTLGQPAYLAAACRALDAVWTLLRDQHGALHRVFKDTARIPAFLEDHAYLAVACLDVHRAGGGVVYLERARAFCRDIQAHFPTEDGQGFYATAAHAPDLLVRARVTQDEAIPSAASAAITALYGVGQLTGDAAMVGTAQRALEACSGELHKRPTAYASWLCQADTMLRGGPQVVIAGPHANVLLQAARALTDATVLVTHVEADAGLLGASVKDGKVAQDGKAAAYVCANQTCLAPVVDIPGLTQALRQAGLLVSAHVVVDR